MQMHQHRVINERTDLDERITKLAGFIGCTVYQSLPASEQALLTRQLAVMREYSAILAQRIAGWTS